MQADIWEELLDRTPVFQRAWIFQERFLASRVLHFGNSQIFWECRSENYCETYPTGFLQYANTSTSYLMKCTYGKLQSLTSLQFVTHPCFTGIAAWPAVSQMQIIWEDVTTEYTRCDLTKSSDKLIALSGMPKDSSLPGQAESKGKLCTLPVCGRLIFRKLCFGKQTAVTVGLSSIERRSGHGRPWREPLTGIRNTGSTHIRVLRRFLTSMLSTWRKNGARSKQDTSKSRAHFAK